MSVGRLSKSRLDRLHARMSAYVERGEVPGLVTLVSRRGEIHADAVGSLSLPGGARRHRSGEATDHRARSAHLSHGLRRPDAVQRRSRHARRARRARVGNVVRRFSPRTHLRAARHEGPSFYVPKNKHVRFATSYLTAAWTRALTLFDSPTDGQWSAPPPFASGAAGLVSTADDLCAFGEMLLGHGVRGTKRVLARTSISLMTADHLSASQKPPWGLAGEYFDTHGFGFGMSVVTRASDNAGTVGTFGWDGGLGTTWYCDPREGMVSVLMTQASWTSPAPPNVSLDFLTSVYAAIDD